MYDMIIMTVPMQYCGLFFQEECEIPLYPGSDLPELSHVVIGLESEYYLLILFLV